ncbi:MAG: hypothetical protein BroJett040_20000 [Oligoflexia bacterium]|nr:MAG: hypothetical protein BroJett040_20000 [Oligoflexia bacterium]
MKLSALIFTFFIAVQSSASNGLEPWIWKSSQCQTCGVYFQPAKNIQFDDRALEFKKALEEEKPRILEIYEIHSQEYNLLAWMALGILGNESKFFTSPRYQVKEHLPLIVRAGKIVKSNITGRPMTDNSRGPTQIKKVPARIEYHYNIQPKDLRVPRHAAVATVGFLIEALEELKTRATYYHLDYINQDTYADYLPYVYTGQSKKLIQGTATPEKNLYVQAMKKNMNLFKVYEVLY